MWESVRRLLTEVLDYAGVFPPAGLPLGEALGYYARWCAGPEGWLLGRFLCPAARLDELAACAAELFAPDRPCRVAVVAGQHPLTPEFVADVRLIDRLVKRPGMPAVVEAVEIRLPGETTRAWRPEAVAEGLHVLADKLVEHHLGHLEVFLEPVIGEAWTETVRRLVAVLQRHDQGRGPPAPARVGFKLRTGGLDAAAFPTAGQVAVVLAACRDAGLPLKFTGGMHQALRHHDLRLSAEMHGFLNVFVAGALAHARGVEEAVLIDVLMEREAHAFEFSEDGLRWRGLAVAVDEIDAARSELVRSFGSCSFDEPREALKALQLV